MSDIRSRRQALIERILRGEGLTAPEQRAAAFANSGVTESAAGLISKVVKHASSVTDDDIHRARQSGLSEDQLFELVVCGAVGAASRQHDAALEALAAAVSER